MKSKPSMLGQMAGAEHGMLRVLAGTSALDSSLMFRLVSRAGNVQEELTRVIYLYFLYLQALDLFEIWQG